MQELREKQKEFKEEIKKLKQESEIATKGKDNINRKNREIKTDFQELKIK